MKPKRAELLGFIANSSEFIIQHTSGRSFEGYMKDPLLRFAVERQFITIGEAVSLLSRMDRSIEFDIPNYRDIIDFRNVLVHLFFKVDNARVWYIINNTLPLLRQKIQQLLQEFEED